MNGVAQPVDVGVAKEAPDRLPLRRCATGQEPAYYVAMDEARVGAADGNERPVAVVVGLRAPRLGGRHIHHLAWIEDAPARYRSAGQFLNGEELTARLLLE